MEFWYARDLMSRIGCDRWENFAKVIDKARTACKSACGIMENHFRDVSKMVDVGSGAKREVDDVAFARYAS